MSNDIPDSWLNIYKPLGVSSAAVVGRVKKILNTKKKVGHAGTLDPEAEGVLPIAIGEATKLMRVLVDTKKEYIFKVKFGAETDTLDRAGVVVKTSSYIPTKDECETVVKKFLGNNLQMPPIFSALKVRGKRACDIAREGGEVELSPRNIYIYELDCLSYDEKEGAAVFRVLCSKGTYVRSLAKDIALCLQSVGFVLELARVSVGLFQKHNSILVDELFGKDPILFLERNKLFLRPELVLADIPVLDVDDSIAKNIRQGKNVMFSGVQDLELCWLRHKDNVLAIGSIEGENFLSSRVFNLNLT